MKRTQVIFLTILFIVSAVPAFGAICSDAADCNNNGTCESGSCVCDNMHNGTYCENVNMCYGIAATNATVCSGKGSCINDDQCVCQPGYVGADCQVATCNGISENDPSVCSGNGSCTAVDTCECNSGYSGQYCQTKESTGAGVNPGDDDGGLFSCSTAGGSKTGSGLPIAFMFLFIIIWLKFGRQSTAK